MGCCFNLRYIYGLWRGCCLGLAPGMLTVWYGFQKKPTWLSVFVSPLSGLGLSKDVALSAGLTPWATLCRPLGLREMPDRGCPAYMVLGLEDCMGHRPILQRGAKNRFPAELVRKESVMVKCVRLADGVVAGFTGANSDAFTQVENNDLSVANLAGSSTGNNGIKS